METPDNKSETTGPKKDFLSVQNLPKVLEDNLGQHLSAPFFWHCYKETESPPFKKPLGHFKPCLLIGAIVDENDVIELIGALETVSEKNQCIGDFLIKKKIVDKIDLTANKFLISLFIEVIDYSAQKNFCAFKLACLLTIYTSVHNYFKSYYWSKPVEIWNYFKEVMIRHSIEDSPDGQEVFSPEECYDIMTHFHTNYLSNLPLVHMITFGSHTLKYVWPYSIK